MLLLMLAHSSGGWVATQAERLEGLSGRRGGNFVHGRVSGAGR